MTQDETHARLLPGVVQGAQTVRSFRALLANTLVANVTTSYLWFALTFWAYLETRSVLATSIVGGTYMLLVAIFGMLFGTLADRHRKKAVMAASSVVTLVSYALAGVLYLSFPKQRLVDWNGWVFWAFALVILVGGVVESLRNIALATCVTLLVPSDDRAKANGLVGTVQGISFMVTSVFSGLSVGQLWLGWTTAIAIGLTALSLAHLLTVRVPEATPQFAEGEKPGIYDVKGAISAIVTVPGLVALIFFAVFNNLLGGAYMSLMDPYGLNLFSVEAWGFVLGLTSIGFIVGGAFVAKFGLGPKPLRTLLSVNVGVALLGMGFVIRESAWLFAIGIFIFMCLMPIAEAAEQTLLQRVVPFEKQGRVFGFSQSVESAASPVSAFLIGPLTQFVLIPYMASTEGRSTFGWLLGTGETRGLALGLVFAGFLLLITAVIAFVSPPYRQLTAAYDAAVAADSESS